MKEGTRQGARRMPARIAWQDVHDVMVEVMRDEEVVLEFSLSLGEPLFYEPTAIRLMATALDQGDGKTEAWLVEETWPCDKAQSVFGLMLGMVYMMGATIAVERATPEIPAPPAP